MSKRCARCGSPAPRRSLKPSGSWVEYLKDERNVSAVGTLVVPLCRECYADATDVEDGDPTADADVRAFLDDIDVGRLVDQTAG